MSEKDPEKLPWKDLNIEVVIESTRFFTKREDAGKYIYSGAKMVVVSNAPWSPQTLFKVCLLQLLI